MKVPLAGGIPTVLAVDQEGPRSIAVDDKYVYWANMGIRDRGTIMKTEK